MADCLSVRNMDRLGGLGGGNRLAGLANPSSSPSPPAAGTPAAGALSQREVSTPQRERQPASPLSAVWPSNDGLGQSSPSRAPDPRPSPPQGDLLGVSSATKASDWSGGAAAGQQEVAALRWYLAAVQREIADRDRQLEELAVQEA